VTDATETRLTRVAALVAQLSLSIENKEFSAGAAGAAVDQLDDLVQLLDGRTTADAQQLHAALIGLQAILVLKRDSAAAQPAPRNRTVKARAKARADRSLGRMLRRVALVVGATAAVSSPLAAAAQTSMVMNSAITSMMVVTTTTGATVTVGSQIINPNNGNPETVQYLSADGKVAQTTLGNVIILVNAKDETYSAEQLDGSFKTYKVDVVPVPNGAGRITSLTLKEGSNAAFTQAVVTNKQADIDAATNFPPGTGGGGSGSPFTFPAAGGNGLAYVNSVTGQPGGNGSDGGGIRICFGILGCLTIGKNPTDGGPGASATPLDVTLTPLNWAPLITTTNDGAPGIVVSSVGGDGGAGGSAYSLGIGGADGGKGGDGGNVKLTNSVEVHTQGFKSHGIFAQSRSGRGGTGGTGNGVSNGGTGGAPGVGGTVEVINNADILTKGERASGILAQSLGGGSGNGGDSYGIVGESGGSQTGGKGGAVKVTNNGKITTEGASAHGILAQSIGGSGGDAGDAGGIAALGAAGAAGGDGGTVEVINNGEILTSGHRARGVFAQSIGGGGGNGGDGSGLVAVGGGGTIGGQGDTVTVTNTGKITTQQEYSHGIFAQSVGGGGGSGGDAGALVSIGGDAGNGNTGGVVTVTNSGSVTTHGAMSSAIQAQSVGGGGGEGGSTGGAFLTIGGGGGTGGDSDVVTVNHSGSLSTTGNDSHGIFAQSVGGGGGNGGSSTSISAFAGVSIGGDGAVGGDGKQVDINLTPSGGGGEPTIFTSGDRSRGIFAQSVGGGGGNGGFAAQTSVGYGIGASAAIGGDGGAGGIGGLVTLDGDVNVHTTGVSSQGIFAQSVGGGGGAGGMALSFSFAAGDTAAAAFSLALGGQGAGGGDGGEVQLNSGGSIVTEKQFATGLVAQSVGGGGGDGGMAVAFSGSAAGVASASVSVGIGGNGAGGGDGKKVQADFDGDIATGGDDAAGAIIQSVGGGGGNGGYSVSGAVTAAGVAGLGVSVGLGGSGGGGGDGDWVIGRVGGDVTTEGERSSGVIVQSVGGGGGNGGFNISGAFGGGGAVGLGMSVGLGGSGGIGGHGGRVEGSVGGVIYTTQDQSTGLLVQSVGGGGGNGGFNISGAIGGGQTVGGALAVGLGGAGGGGGNAGYVFGEAEDSVFTSGNQSSGVVIQSLGGGGGNGAFNISGAIGASQTVGAAISVGVGGAGGGGGYAEEVHAFAKSIVTTGDQSVGFLAQSVGGGGGSGGFNVSGSIGASQTVGVGVSVGVGGAGGGGGEGKLVEAVIDGDVFTTGLDSEGVIAQSLGGGGGRGGFAVGGSITAASTGAASISVGVGGAGGLGGASGKVTLDITGAVGTAGKDSDAITAQSIAGGGGAGGFSVAAGVALSSSGAGTIGVGVGGQGGGGGTSGQVILNVNENVLDPNDDLLATLTTEDGSRGVVAQSVGGGGGAGGFNITGGVAIASSGAGNIGVGVGGGGGLGGDGGLVTANVGGDVITAGASSGGVLAQSLGGGGGSGGFNISGGVAASTSAAGNLLVGVGGTGGVAGFSKAVDGVVRGDVITLGANSGGVTYQSLGGGGGAGGFNITGGVALQMGPTGGAGNLGVGVGGFGGAGGDGATVDAGVIGDVATLGDDSYGILMQSAGGGGGSGGFNITGLVQVSSGTAGSLGVGIGGFAGGGGSAFKVTGNLTGDVYTQGKNAFGATLQSLGGAGGNGGMNVTGSVNIAAGNGAAIAIGVGVGGFGGDGGEGGDVEGYVAGDYFTIGDNSDGLVAQSLGGGGGNGGLNITGALALSGGTAGTAGIGIGGYGGKASNAGIVDLFFDGRSDTVGNNSDAIKAQSIGGGGGNGGISVGAGVALGGGGAGNMGVVLGGMGGEGGDAKKVTLKINEGVADPIGDLIAATTQGDGSRGVVAQSLGGSGGNGGFSISGGIAIGKSGAGNLGVGIGGGGGDGGNAGEVTASVNGDVSTAGDDAKAIFAQSVGGGGGDGGFNVTGGIAGTKDAGGNILVGVGGFGGLGGEGKKVDGVVTSDVTTDGDRSGAVTYQSLGGGGGVGGFNVTGGIAVSIGNGSVGNIGIGIGGFGGGGGDAGEVDVALTGDVTTSGDDSYGILLQSAGGGGGAGGMNITGGLSASKSGNGSFGFGLGGFGGGAGAGKKVTGVLTGDVSTNGLNAYGAMLQSVGGAGGVGGINVTGTVALTFGNNAAGAIGVGIGGFGGDGGGAGAVDGTVIGQYVTVGDNADGVIAQSLGGGGGNGGLNVTGSLAMGGGSAGTAAIGIGGFGGDGGDSSTVDLVRVGDTFTDGDNADGVLAQSLAGGGGNGGINVSAGLSGSSSGSTGGFVVGIGGFGGDGGTAQKVTASVTGNVIAKGHGAVTTDTARTVTITDDTDPLKTTDVDIASKRIIADGSNGVIAQSVGGGGGNGGMNISGGVSVSLNDTSKARAVTIGIGGFGGGGGDAGAVDLTVVGPTSDHIQVLAVGDNRYAVAAQSLGGGGGNGGINISGGISLDGQLTVGIGGFGGDGGIGADVDADVTANLFASGERSRGLLAQSVGGGGGTGAINITGGLQLKSSTKEPVVAFGLGGEGGAGNISGDVNATQDGQVWVDGVQAVGVLVQSVAGGGGDGGLNVTADVSLAGSAQSKGFAIAAGIGGTGGTGADAGEANLFSVGDVIVNGRLNSDNQLIATDYTGGATGILVQSVGGGGGTGGVNVTGAIAPSGSPVALGVGGSGGSGGDGGAASLNRGFTVDANGVETVERALVRTFGDYSDGVVVQSIGGGGGNAGFNAVIVASKGNSADNTVSAILAVGGGGAGAGKGDTVDVRQIGDIVTDGKRSNGLLAQSIGGGGGNATYNLGFGLQKNANALNMTVGGATGAAGDGGDVTVDHSGVIYVQGDESKGLIAQSIGGGGGNAGTDKAMGLKNRNEINMSIGRVGGSGGTGGVVDVTVAGRVQTLGATNSTAILAQSIGGGGGSSSATSMGVSLTKGKDKDAETTAANVAVGLDGGVGATGGDVTVRASGEVYTQGSDSRGIHAQSVGGGGGTGGSADNSVSSNTQSLGVAVGGKGGVGATSGKVEVDTSAVIKTTGATSDGVLAQSVGGGGGMGGMVTTTQYNKAKPDTDKVQRSATFSVGGDGGTGAVGGAVEVNNSGVIWTEGRGSFGVRAQSVGGGGGVGGMVANITIQRGGENQSFDLNLGGDGGTGAAAGRVDVLNEGLIYTAGDGAAGISANSIGGGGGDAGTVISLTLGSTDKKSSRFNLNIGGSGGDGGTGGDVEVINRTADGVDDGKIITKGRNAYGVLAQSIGGGGGNGSTVMFLSGLKSAEDSVTGALNIGGAGGSGNTAGAVHVANSGLIDTTGDGAHGILAQSIGGGGGNGGLVLAGNFLKGSGKNTPMISVGGLGGDGGDGGTVTVDNTGSIVTRGKGANGIVAQSIGGGGGDAQFGIGLNGDYKSLALSSVISTLVGAFGGGSGGQGGDVYVNQTGAITVLGDNARAIRAESINGGGGSISLDLSGVVGLPGNSYVDLHGETRREDPMVLAQLGGSGVQNSNAGKVHIVSNGTLQVGGDRGVAVFNQSVAGGGGTLDVNLLLSGALDVPDLEPPVPLLVETSLGGANGRSNNGGGIDSQHTGDVTSIGEGTGGVLVQTIGGGGGQATIDIEAPTGAQLGSVTTNLGGSGGQDEAGGALNRMQSGGVATSGDFGIGAILQSVGGGGGSAGVSLHGEGSSATTVIANLGANGGSGLDGGAVNAVLSGAVNTFGDHGVGLVVQSVGGGGGEVHVSGGGATQVGIGGSDGATGDGQAVTLANNGDIVTRGDGAHGVVLQSIGGGGGALFGGNHTTVTTHDANVGDGGAIDFQQNGGVYAGGDGAFGVIVQSLGGGGGWVDGAFAGSAGGQGAGGAITLALNGAVVATGADATGVFVQSEGEDGAGDIHVTAKGAVRGGSGKGAAIQIAGGENNTVETQGLVSALSGLAISSGDGNELISNHNLMIGDIDLGAGDNGFVNSADGVFVAYRRIDLRDPAGAPTNSAETALADPAPSDGFVSRNAVEMVAQAAPANGGVFTNAGDFRMGLDAPRVPLDLLGGAIFANRDGEGPAGTNPWYGARVITTTALDGDFVQTSTGHMAFDVAFGPYGSDRVNATGKVAVAGKGDVTLTWLENTKPLTLFATTAGTTDNGLQITDSLALDYSVHATNGGLTLDFRHNFAQAFLNKNEKALGEHLNSALAAGDSAGIGRLMALVGNLKPGQEVTYKSLFRTLSPEPFVAPFGRQLVTANSFANQMFSCATGVELNGRCVWVVAEKADGETKGDAETMAVDTSGERLRMGVEMPGRDDWSLATAVGYERLRGLHVDGWRSYSDGQAVTFGMGLKRRSPSGLQMSASLSAGYQWLDTVRQAEVFQVGRGESSPRSAYTHAAGGIAYVMSNGRLFAEPALNISMTGLHQTGFKEKGLGGLGVEGLSSNELLGTANPQLTVGVLLKDDATGQAALSFTVGGVFNSTDKITMPYRLMGANPTATPFSVGADIDKQALKLGLDARIIGDDRVSARFSYSAEFGDKTDNRTAGLNVRIKF
jgi:hypothetical protein